MTQQVINIGTQPGDGSGDPLRVSFNKINQNFAEIYATLGTFLVDISSGNDYGSIVGIYGVDYGFITDPATIFLDYGSI